MQTNFTATLNADSKSSWKAIQKHVDHDPNVNHANKDIDKSKTYRNIEITNLASYEKTLQRQYGAFVKEHDETQDRPERRYGSVDNYVKRQKGNPDERLVFTFGNKESNEQLKADLHQQLDPDDLNYGEVEDRYYKAINNGFRKYCQGFNRRNSNLTMTEAKTNVDELGGEHGHAQVVSCGHTAKGKPSAKLSNALREQYDIKTAGKQGRTMAMKKWREQEDTALMRNMSNSFQAEFPELHLKPFKLIRTGQKTSLDMDTYKKQQKELEELRQQKEDAEQSLERSRKAVFDQHQLAEKWKEEAEIAEREAASQESFADDMRQKGEERATESLKLQKENKDLKFENEELKEQNENLTLNQETTEKLLFYGFKMQYKDKYDDKICMKLAKGQVNMKFSDGTRRTGVELFNFNEQLNEKQEQQTKKQQKTDDLELG